jgi:hypothetical protein
MKIVREQIEFERGSEPYKKLGVGIYRPGTPKDFKDVKPMDTAIDYNDDKWKVLAKEIALIHPGDTRDSDYPGIVNVEALDFLQTYDRNGAMADFFREFLGDFEYGDEVEMISVLATKETESYQEGGKVVFHYGEDGAVAIW